METIIMTVQLLLGLSILVGVHEWGHLAAAKAFGMRVEKYSIGFPPKIWGKKFGETEYSIGAIPLGGFVKISGMIDESLDTESLSEEPEPWEFRAKPAWQRLIVMLGGIIVNVITGIIIFIALTYSQGERYLSKEELNKHGIVAYELGEKIGFKTGDKVININGQDFQKFRDLISPDVLLGTDGYYTVLRDGQEVRIDIPNNFLDDFSEGREATPFIIPLAPFKVGTIPAGSDAIQGGLQEGDKFITVQGQPIRFYDDLATVLDQNKNGSVNAVVDRDGQQHELNLIVNENGKLKIGIQYDIDYSTNEFTFGESVSRGTNRAFSVVWVNIKAFGKIFSGDISPRKSLSGPIGIAGLFGGDWDWVNFWNITGLLSMVLAFMNLLPIPALDGGHVMFLTWEMVTGRKPSDKFLENAQKVGMVLILGLMVFVIFNDISKFF
ncbi:MAG: RIP metalloprotease RseP [Cytophagales bacterium]|nr:RIP metalloprotease RseP [Cytophagales bacterium]